MKISLQEVDRIRQSQSVSRVNGNGTNGNGKANGANGHSSAASVEVSATAQEIQRVKKLVNSVSDVREDVVQSLKARIESGNYNISGADIADLMVRRAVADSAR
jgi:negative regulator of flagellin synthesis FlgM